MGVTVTFVAILELMREGLIDIVQAEPFAPLHVRGASPSAIRLWPVSPMPTNRETGQTALEALYADEPPSDEEE